MNPKAKEPKERIRAMVGVLSGKNTAGKTSAAAAAYRKKSYHSMLVPARARQCDPAHVLLKMSFRRLYRGGFADCHGSLRIFQFVRNATAPGTQPAAGFEHSRNHAQLHKKAGLWAPPIQSQRDSATAPTASFRDRPHDVIPRAVAESPWVGATVGRFCDSASLRAE